MLFIYTGLHWKRWIVEYANVKMALEHGLQIRGRQMLNLQNNLISKYGRLIVKQPLKWTIKSWIKDHRIVIRNQHQTFS